MEAPSNRRVSLRGASAREYSRNDLLEKISSDRASRQAARRMAASALTIQRIWRGRRAARAARNEARSAWDARILQVQSSQKIPTAEIFSRDILRPFIFITRHLTCRARVFPADDLHRVSICFQMLLQSFSLPDERNFCSLAFGSSSQRAEWFYQAHRLFTISSAILLGRCFSDEISTPLVSLVMRLIVTLTDPKALEPLRNHFNNNSNWETCDITLRLLEWLGSGASGFYIAAHTFLREAYPLHGKGGRVNPGTKENFVVITGLITMALRPLHATMNRKSQLQELEHSKREAATHVCEQILTVPCLVDRIPAGLLPAFQHRGVLEPCLEVFKSSSLRNVSHAEAGIPLQAWALANLISIVATHNGFLKQLDFNEFAEAFCGAFQGLTPWIEERRESRITLDELDDEEPESSPAQEDSLSSSFIRRLKPLCNPAQIVQLLESAGAGLPLLSRVYSHLLGVFSVLNGREGALPVLNALAFTKQLLPRLWEWLRESLKFEPAQGSRTQKDESPGARQQQQSNWANSLLKKMKTSTSTSSAEASGAESDRDSWHIIQMTNGPAGIPEDSVPVLTLFCTVYAHLLLVLDDDEFYSRQVPFNLDDQRMICAALNTMVYHGFYLRQQFSTLMEAACRCLRALYERDSRHSFCPAELWLAPSSDMRPAIAAAARAHEVASISGESSHASAMGSILTTIPHVLPFEERVQIFREFVKGDKAVRKMGGEQVAGPGPGSLEITIRRDHVVEDAFQQLNGLGSKLKGWINVSFVNEYGLPEAGLDYGGLFKEFLTELAKAAFDPGYGLFLQTATEEGFLFPHPAGSILAQGLRTMEFLGRIVGKALYEGILLEHSFSPVFISKILGRYSPIDDLSSLDSELHRNLMYLKTYEGDVADLALDFTVTEEIFGKRKVIELIPGGSKVPVTSMNKLQYVHAMADYKLNRQVRLVVNAFIRGLTDLIAPSWLGLFNAKEFNQLLSGEEHEFDVHDLKEHTRYTGGYTENSRTVKLFWEVLESLDTKERCAVLKFVTSCSRAPLLGFKHLQPPFTIHKVICDTPVWTFLSGQDVDRLPTASTCYNILKLPSYRRSSTLREKLQYAIRSNSGFELS